MRAARRRLSVPHMHLRIAISKSDREGEYTVWGIGLIMTCAYLGQTVLKLERHNHTILIALYQLPQHLQPGGESPSSFFFCVCELLPLP